MLEKSIDTIAVVGCGGIGSILSFYLALRSNDCNDIKHLILLDNDILENKNLPYLTITTPRPEDSIDVYQHIDAYIGNPKVYALEFVLDKYKSKYLNITPIYSSYEKFIYEKKSKKINECFIDCRDISSTSDDFLLKLSCDGPYAKLIYKPKTIEYPLYNNRYTINSSCYYSNLFMGRVMDFIFGSKTYIEGIYIFNFYKDCNPELINLEKYNE